jgi:hypothetical protein
MRVYDRLKMELSNQQYLTTEQYCQLLIEQGLDPAEEYDKASMQKALLLTEIEVLETIANDIDIMSSFSSDFANIGQAYEFVEARIVNLKDKIAAIPIEEEEVSAFALMYTRGRGIPGKRYESIITGVGDVTREDIDDFWDGKVNLDYTNDRIDEWFKED